MPPKTIIGLDVGRSAVKVVAHAAGLYYRLSFPSLVTPASVLSFEESAQAAELETVEIAGRRLFTGDTARQHGRAEISAGLSDTWTNGPEYLALIAGAMKRLAAQGVPGLDSPYIVLGTPASLFRREKERLVEQTRAILDAEMKVLPQPMGAYCSYFLDSRGVPIRERRLRSDGKTPRSWAVVDVGHFTTDFLLMRAGTYDEAAAVSCGGVNLAVQALQRLLTDRNINVSPLAAEEALRTGTVFSFGERDVNAEVDEAVEPLIQSIQSTAGAVLSKQAEQLDGILIAGGGASIVAAPLKKMWPHTAVLDNPRMAVADGFCRYGVGQMLVRAAKQTAGADA